MYRKGGGGYKVKVKRDDVVGSGDGHDMVIMMIP